MTPPIELLRARLWASETCPYFSTALWAVSLNPVSGLQQQVGGPMAIDKWWRLYYDPEFVAKSPKEMVGTGLLHEINHVIRSHFERVGGREHMRFMIAGDLSINDDLTQFHLIQGALLPPQFGLENGKTEEWYYDKLEGKVKTVKVCWDCGSGAHGKPGDYELPAPKDGRVGEKDGISAVQGDLIRAEVAREIMKQPGTVSAGLRRWAEAIIKPRVDWRTLLRRYIRAAYQEESGALDYSYGRPARRQWPKVILPKMISRKMDIAVVVDTSGSISQAQLEQAVAEVKGICRVVAADSKVFFVDTVVCSKGRVGDSSLEKKAAGGGGTDMGEGIRAALAESKRVGLVVVLTDGYTPWPQEKPSVPVVVALLGTEEATPAWASRVVIPMEE